MNGCKESIYSKMITKINFWFIEQNGMLNCAEDAPPVQSWSLTICSSSKMQLCISFSKYD